MKRSTLGWFATLLLVPSVGLAVTTKSFVVDTSEAFEKGTLKGTAAHSSGKLTRGMDSDRKPIDGVPVAYASALGKDGAVYVATGNEGAIYRATSEGAKLFADTDAALVTSLVWVDDTLYAGTLPGGRVFAISADGKSVREFARLPAAEHVWALVFSAKQRALFAGTGPEGKLFSIDLKGKVALVHDDAAEHLLCLDVDSEGRIYAGTSNGARVLRITPSTSSDKKKEPHAEVQVLYDFPGQEVTTLDLGPSFIAVASNDFPAPPPPLGDAKDLGVAARTKRLKPGKGVLYTLGYNGRIDDLQHFDASHISALEIDPASGTIYAGLAQEGHIVQVGRNGEHALWADVDERQIAAIHLQAKPPYFVSSDGVAVYRVRDPRAEGEWLSAVLDAKVPARFGELTLRARGSVRWATRSGNTETPDDSWSPWSNDSAAPGPIKSPSTRFLQLRSKLAGDAELYALEAYYLPQNLAAHVRNVRSKAPSAPDSSKPRPTMLALTWDVDNPDEDKLRYRLHVRREGQSTWLPLLRDYELLETTDYNWETRALPDGYYRVRVTVSDDATNPAPYVALSEAIGAPLLVDNHAPELRDLRYQAGQLTGRAVDALGPVSLLELAIDSGLYRPIFPIDDLLDTRDEAFRIDLPELARGTHTLAVRATDAAQNVTSSAIEVTLPTP